MVYARVMFGADPPNYSTSGRVESSPVAVVSRQSKQMLTVLVEAGVALLAAIAMTLAFAGELVSEQASHRSRADLVPQPVVQR